MLSVICALCRQKAHHADCRSAECHSAECRSAEYHYTECRSAECCSAECRSAECCSAECRSAECCGAKSLHCGKKIRVAFARKFYDDLTITFKSGEH
jgi:hypothetical protein